MHGIEYKAGRARAPLSVLRMRSFWTLLALASLAAAAAAAAAPPAQRRVGQRIVGGEPTTIERNPYMGSMIYGWFGVWWFQACGATVLTSTTLLSAAHCFYGDSETSWQVRLGSSFTDRDGVLSAVSQLILHEEYDDSMLNNDVAIVRLATPAPLGPTITPALIAGTDYLLPDNTPLTALGWGDLSHGGVPSDQLQRVEKYTINQKVCRKRYDYLRTQPAYVNWPVVTETMVCAGVLDVGGRDACDGDSGGPLVHADNVVYGVISWGFECAHQHYPGVALAVNRFTDWIVQNGSN